MSSPHAYYITVKCRDVPSKSLFIVLDHLDGEYSVRGLFTYATDDVRGLTDEPVEPKDLSEMTDLTVSASSLAEVLNRVVGISSIQS